MGILILIIAGALFGWLATIILEIDDVATSGHYAIIGSVSAALGGFAISGARALTSLSPVSLLAGIVASAGALALMHYLKRTKIW